MAKLSVSQSLQKAKKFEKRAQYHEAREIYEQVLAAFPNNVRAREGLRALPTSAPDASRFTTPREKIVEIIQQFERGQYEKAIRGAKQIVKKEPGLGVAWKVVGLASQKAEKLEDAEAAFQRALQIEPTCFETHNNLGVVFSEQGKFEQAVASYQKSGEANPRYFRAFFNLGIALRDLDRLEEAVSAYEKAISLNSDHAESHHNLGNIYSDQGSFEKARAAYEKALALEPGYAEAHDNFGVLYYRTGDLKGSIDEHTRAIEIKPGLAQAHNNLGIVYLDQARMKEAAESFGRAVQFQDDYADAYCNLAKVFNELGHHEQALKNANAALQADPDFLQAMHEKVTALERAKSYQEAIALSNELLKRQPDNMRLKAKVWFMASHICDWEHIDRFEKEMVAAETDDSPLQPGSMLTLQDAPIPHLKRSRHFGDSIIPPWPKFPAQSVEARPKRLRIGLVSPDFKDHPVARLIMGMLRNFDRSKYELIAFSSGGEKDDALQLEVAALVDRFIDLTDMPEEQRVGLLKQNRVDIAIDLAGYTQGSCTKYFALDIAPVQIQFLGYAGSLNFDAIQYVIGDKTLIPPDCEAHYSEKVIHLPNSFMPADDQLAVSDRPLTRAEFGLPEEGFVFCAFNKAYKIRPAEFEIWMRLLDQVDGSVLWLSGAHESAVSNLRRQAELAGIDPDRLVMAGWVDDNETHLARMRLADLFIDTFNYNAHTTSVEALYVGLPVVTKCGEQFAARVATSVLNAAGLPELSADSEQAYYDLILDLATNPAKLKSVREKLASIGPQSALFDTAQYTRDFEKGLELAFQRYLDGEPAADIVVSAAG